MIRGARLGNLNAIKTGRHSRTLVVGKLPKGLSYVAQRLRVLRRQIEAAVLDVRGVIDFTDQHVIQTAVRWEMAAAVAQHTLATVADLTADQRVSFAQYIAKASTERDKSLAQLKLRRDHKDVLAALYTRVDQPAVSEAVRSDQNATEAQPA
jgi:hypothetical protein